MPVLTAEDEWLAIRCAPVAARGVLADVLYLMRLASDKGSVRDDDVTARMIGISAAELGAHLQTLAHCGVLELTGGSIISPRLRQEQRRRDICKANGCKGGRPRKLTASSPDTVVKLFEEGRRLIATAPTVVDHPLAGA
jgi:hypothetical protein